MLRPIMVLLVVVLATTAAAQPSRRDPSDRLGGRGPGGSGMSDAEDRDGRRGGRGGLAPAGPTGVDGQVAPHAVDRMTLCGIGRLPNCDAQTAVDRGLFPTGLRPRFPAGLKCPDIDEAYAISYSHKRDREVYHGGIDMPASYGTPILAAADGQVIGIYSGIDSMRGIEVMLRHTPQDTGIPLYIYTQYAHLHAMPDLAVGQRVRMGQTIGPTGNSGSTPSQLRSGRERRPAIHFAAWFTASPQFVAFADRIVPLDSYWMDPVALYRLRPPFDSQTMKALPAAEKAVPIPVMLADGTTQPAGTRLIWPYACSR